MALSRARVELDRFSGFVSTHSQDCVIERETKCQQLKECISSAEQRKNSHSCSSPFAVAPISSILTRTGLFIESLVNSETLSVTVAEKRRVCRDLGAAVMISSSSARKP